MPRLGARAEHALCFADGEILDLGVRTRIMGILNVTPDSFSDGGRFLEPAAATDHAARLVEEGADLIDVGGESTRPGASAVSPADEAGRVLPVVHAIKRRLRVRVSVDTTKAEVARAALDAGADMINDISGLTDPDMLALAAERGVPVVVMHMRGSPATMQRHTDYPDLIGAIHDFLRESIQRAAECGLGSDRIIVDPGIGFGKSVEGNLSILGRLREFASLDRPILIGASRKSFIGTVLDLPAQERLEGSLAAAAVASGQGAHIIRAHDVAATSRVVRLVDAIRNAVSGE